MCIYMYIYVYIYIYIDTYLYIKDTPDLSLYRERVGAPAGVAPGASWHPGDSQLMMIIIVIIILVVI